MITTLIDKQDNFEIVRDQIAAILATEVANQMQLATDAGKDPSLWDLRIYKERSNPWEALRGQNAPQTPIVNVWYEDSAFEKGSSNIMERQAASAGFNVDIFARGQARNTAEGHCPGDENAAEEAARALRLVRNILMAAEYTYLGLRGTVWQRWAQSITVFQPDIGGRAAEQVVGARLKLAVSFNEFAPQIEPVALELLSAQVKRAEDGEIVIEADYNYAP